MYFLGRVMWLSLVWIHTNAKLKKKHLHLSFLTLVTLSECLLPIHPSYFHLLMYLCPQAHLFSCSFVTLCKASI